jgi:hypothetical protein
MKALSVIASDLPTYTAMRRQLIEVCGDKAKATISLNCLMKSGLVRRGQHELTDAGRAVLASLGDA